jgi:hypothetical protein
MSRRVAPPGGWQPPKTATLAGEKVDLQPLAEAVADRYFAEFPEDVERYGDAARAWEVHDTLHCLNWAVLDVSGYTSLGQQITWLAGVLGARDFPLDQLARNLELAADVVSERLGEQGTAVAERLRSAAQLVPVDRGP